MANTQISETRKTVQYHFTNTNDYISEKYEGHWNRLRERRIYALTSF